MSTLHLGMLCCDMGRALIEEGKLTKLGPMANGHGRLTGMTTQHDALQILEEGQCICLFVFGLHRLCYGSCQCMCWDWQAEYETLLYLPPHTAVTVFQCA
jgi:hypothetical protein